MTDKRVIEVLEECIDRLATWRDYARLSRNWKPDEDEPYYSDRIKALQLAAECVKYYAKELAAKKAAKKEEKK